MSFTDGKNDIIVINDVIPAKTISVLDALQALKNCSVFYEMFIRSGLNIFTASGVQKICFTTDICVPVTRAMQKLLSEAVKFNQFTIIAPTNVALKKHMLKTIMAEADAMWEFLRGHVFLGLLGDHNNRKKQHIEIAYSLSADHSVLTASTEDDNVLLKSAMYQVFKVQEIISVTEGKLYIVDMA